MFEVPKKLLNRWNRKLEKAGLPEELEPIEIPVPPSSREILSDMVPELDKLSLNVFLGLHEKLQADIVADIRRQKNSGAKMENVLNRLKLLIKKGIELEDVDRKNLDTKHKPQPSASDRENGEINEAVTRTVNESIEKIKRIVERDNPERGNKHIH